MDIKKITIASSTKKGIYKTNVAATPLVSDKGKEMTPEEFFKGIKLYKKTNKRKLGILCRKNPKSSLIKRNEAGATFILQQTK